MQIIPFLIPFCKTHPKPWPEQESQPVSGERVVRSGSKPTIASAAAPGAPDPDILVPSSLPKLSQNFSPALAAQQELAVLVRAPLTRKSSAAMSWNWPTVKRVALMATAGQLSLVA